MLRNSATVFPKNPLEDHGVEGLVGDELLELAAFLLQATKAFGLADLKATELLLPLKESGLADAVSSGDLSDGYAGLGLLEYLDNLFFGMPGSFHEVGLLKTLSSKPAQEQREAHSLLTPGA